MESDPLFSVLEESQVEINPATGRPRIAMKVLDGMRQYLLPASGPEKIIRQVKIKSSLAEIGNDHIAQICYLSLEAKPVITNKIEKGKYLAFEFQNLKPTEITPQFLGYHTKLLASIIQARMVISEASRPQYFCSQGPGNSYYDDSSSYLQFSSVN